MPVNPAKVRAKALEGIEMTEQKRGKFPLTKHGLTMKQEHFAQGIAEGLTLAEAYRRAYDAENMLPGSVYTAASKLIDEPHVAQRVSAILDEAYRKSLIHNVKWVRRHVFDRLMMESIDKGNAAASRIRALELLGKVDVVGMFSEKTEVTVRDKRGVDEIEAEIKEKLRRFIDHEPIDITPKS